MRSQQIKPSTKLKLVPINPHPRLDHPMIWQESPDRTICRVSSGWAKMVIVQEADDCMCDLYYSLGLFPPNWLIDPPRPAQMIAESIDIDGQCFEARSILAIKGKTEVELVAKYSSSFMRSLG